MTSGNKCKYSLVTVKRNAGNNDGSEFVWEKFSKRGLCGRIEISYARINLLGCIQGIYRFHICVSLLYRLTS